MREYIFDFDQKTMVGLGLTMQDALLLDYLIKFFDSGNAVTKFINRRKYCWITYKKMLDDLPILRRKERQTRRILVGLEEKGIIKRHLENNNRLYIYINPEILFWGLDGSPMLTPDDRQDILCLPAGQAVPVIVRYYKNKIKIISRNARVKDLDGNLFILKLKQKIKPLISEYAFDMHFKDVKIDSISDKLILLTVPSADELKRRPNNPFENVVKEVLTEMISELPPLSEGGGSKSLRD